MTSTARNGFQLVGDVLRAQENRHREVRVLRIDHATESHFSMFPSAVKAIPILKDQLSTLWVTPSESMRRCYPEAQTKIGCYPKSFA